jgi:c(7)-type cytochrome triheme protein
MSFLARPRGACLLLLPLALASLAWRTTSPHEFGRVVLDNFSSRARIPPVAFDHWRHRALFTCRLCHVDIGFAMAARGTQISASTNRAGFHCGACHNGRTLHKGKPIFASCSDASHVDEGGACRRCHTRGDPARLLEEYAALAEKLPRDRLGGIDWEKAEAEWLIKPLDFLEGISIKRSALRMDKEVALAAKAVWMTDVLFSHRKHAVWSGCEVCHPDIFPRTQVGENRYSMLQISEGEYCGACHDKVAFPLADCERCHLKPVR